MNEREMFEAALELPPKDRGAYLDGACGEDTALRERLEALLHKHDRAGSFLEKPELDVRSTTEEQPMSERPGTVIGSYKLLEQIGEGGFGVVFMAEQLQPVRRKVALKVLKPGMDTGQVVARFEAERQALALMEHPNIARVFDGGGTASGRPYFVMELVKGLPITDFCDQNQLPVRERLELFINVCQAVQHAHQKGVIHRDVKPSNVLVTMHDGTPLVKVIDFGIAKALGQQLTDKTLFTHFAQMIGTPLYMSPEQAALSNLDVDTRSDVYSLGVLLYELLTGTTPFEMERLQTLGYDEIRRIIREEEPPKPSTRISTLGLAASTISSQRKSDPRRLSQLFRGELDWVVMKALEKDRNRRYESASAFAADVERYLADEPVQACPPSTGYRLRKFVSRHRGPVVATTVILLCLVAGIATTSTALAWALGERDAKAKALAAETEERQSKEKALAAETRALAVEKQAREGAMSAARDLADEIVEKQLGQGSHLTDENKEFLRKIIKHFEGLAALAADDADSRGIRAEGYYRVGVMRHRLGELREAEAAYTEALAIRKQLAADFPNQPEMSQNLAWSQNNLGVLLGETGRPKEAEAAHADALAIRQQLAAQFPNRPEFRRELATSHLNLGAQLHSIGRLKEAEAAYADALAIQKQLGADFPTRPEFRQELAASQLNLGLLLHKTGRLKEAEAAYAEALAIQKQVVADFPTRPEFRRYLGICHSSLGILLGNTGRLKEAEAAHVEALAIQKRVVADFPTRPEFRRDLARFHQSLGALLERTDRLKDSEAAHADAVAIRKQLATDFPDRPEFRRDLAWSHYYRGLLLRHMDRLKEAEAAYADALAIQKQLVADFPQQPDQRNELSGSYVNLALLHVDQRDFKAAKADLEAALPHHDSALKANPKNPKYQEFYRNNLVTLIRSNAGLGDRAGALAAAEKLRDLGWDLPGNAYHAACGLALCIPLVEKDDQATKEERDKQMAFYGGEAMKMLRHAVARGFRDAAQVNEDTNLDPLRKREDFQKLLAELDARKKAENK
jgi:serine/threonine protein kinase/tetratricopeptide (TPR) repeat protein